MSKRPDLATRNRLNAASFDDRWIPEPNSGCWLWLGALTAKGYGHLSCDGWTTPAHRHSWQRRNGPIPDGRQVLHRCDTRSCVNPDHAFLGDSAANNADMMAKGRNRPCRGEAHGNATLTAELVKAIRADPRTNVAVAAAYGVSDVTISLIKRRKAWSHI